jgi:hypothetical protein
LVRRKEFARATTEHAATGNRQPATIRELAHTTREFAGYSSVTVGYRWRGLYESSFCQVLVADDVDDEPDPPAPVVEGDEVDPPAPVAAVVVVVVVGVVEDAGLPPAPPVPPLPPEFDEHPTAAPKAADASPAAMTTHPKVANLMIPPTLTSALP